jgi:hypothetical protein
MDVTGANGRPIADLPTGVVFWRAASRAGGTVGALKSETWELYVGARSSPIDGSWGTVLDVNGDGLADVAVGASYANDGVGQLRLYRGRPAGLSTSADWILGSPDGDGGSFGESVASAGDVNGDGFADVIVSDPVWNGSTGRVHLYLGGPGGLASSGTALSSPDGPGGSVGVAVASAGDVNGDGYADVAIGAPGSGDPSSVGHVHVFYGGPTGLSTVPSLSLVGPPGGQFGYSLAGAADLNGDGFPDLAIAELSTSRIHVFGGSASGVVSPAAISLAAPSTSAGGSFGFSVAAADVDGDGYLDLVAGDAQDYAYVYPGGASGLGSTPSLAIYGPGHASCGIADGFGMSVANAGDVNGDGYTDVIVGAPYTYDSTTLLPFGGASVFLGSDAGLIIASWTHLCGGPENQYYGGCVAGVGDVNGDGYGDVAVSDPYFRGTGYVAIFAGSDAGTTTSASASLSDPDAGNLQLGASVY